MPVFTPGIVMEGGSIDVNGRGTLLTTEACLLNPNRNPHLSRREIERYLHDYLGVSNILWLGDGIEGDDTDGHVDDLTRFVDDEHRRHRRRGRSGRPQLRAAPGQPRAAEPDDRPGRAAAPDRDPADAAAALPRGAAAPGELRELLHRQPGGPRARLRPASATPLRAPRCSGSFPNRRVAVIDCTDLVWGLGAFHCVTQQWPAGEPR